MSSYDLGSFGFVRWDGPRPQFVTEHVVEFRKIGQAGIGAQLQGVHGDPFNVSLHAVFADQPTARAAEVAYRSAIGTAPLTLVYEGTNYFTAYGHKYFVHDARAVFAKCLPRLIGPTWDYTGGWLVVSNWVLIPVG